MKLERLIKLTLVLICAHSLSCSTTKQSQVEVLPATQPSTTTAQVQLPSVISPKLSEAQDAVKRVFKDAAVVDTSFTPSFVTGDFNGDFSQDLAVVLKVSPGKTPEMNEQYPSWLLRDPFAQERAELTVKEDERLLAIIHGNGDNNWRDMQATQAYLLKNSVGSQIEVHKTKDLNASKPARRLPRTQGDLIAENLRGAPGYLYYARATYLWFDPKNPSTPSAGMVHRMR